MWLPPIECTAIGASHQRKGKPCQDGSLSRSFINKNGEELHLMLFSQEIQRMAVVDRERFALSALITANHCRWFDWVVCTFSKHFLLKKRLDHIASPLALPGEEE